MMDYFHRLRFVFLFLSFGLIQDCKTARQSDWWPKGVVPYVLDAAFPRDIRDAISSAMQEIEMSVNVPAANSTCIRFVERTNEKYVLKVTHTPGCHSTVGYSKTGLNYMSVGRGCETKEVLLHVLHHVLGFYHEQNRPDRDHHIVINHTNTLPNTQHYFTKKFDMETFGLAYDFESISHIGPYDLSLDRKYPVTTPTHSLGDDVVMGQREKLSLSDVIKVQRAYKCNEDISYVVTHPRNYLVNCHFGKDVCNMKTGSGSEFQWMVKNESVVNGPYAGHSTGIDSFLAATDAGENKGKVAKIESPLSKGGPLCLDFYLYQKGPTSYLNIIVAEEGVTTFPLRSFKGSNNDYWRKVTMGVNVADITKVKVTLEVHVDSGAVALDDLKIYHGECGQ